MDVRGCVSFRVEYKDKSRSVQFYVIKNLAKQCILGLDFLRKFNVEISPDGVSVRPDRKMSSDGQTAVIFNVQKIVENDDDSDFSEIPVVTSHQDNSLVLKTLGRFSHLFMKYPKLFSETHGRASFGKHQIRLKDDIIIKEAPRRIPYHYREQVGQQIKILIES
ncbi:hypothetical protein RF11_08179 [Thelohanellus kitauei]|uniref:Uncharacterized protein n=1 Tax=Thelohanellus kitauei TaxID=669202 RepID=A0A0C2NBS8_THEKT|nr:hypothetical protein RF11_08179 [Thelohanellus kitauei]